MAEETNLTAPGRRENESDESTPLIETAAESTDETEQIREQIEETRAKLGETIEAIQEKLSFENISEQVTEQVAEQVSNIYRTARESVYDATVKKAGKFMQQMNEELKKSNFIKQIGARPLPLFLIALGAGLLYFDSKKGRGRAPGNGHKPRAPRLSGGTGENRSSMLKSAKDSISGAAGSAYESVGNMAGSAYESVGNMAGSAYESVSGLADDTWRKAGELGGQVQEKYEYYLEENPLALGAVALAVGAAVGFAIPATEYENELVGETRENLMARVGEKVGETIDKVKTIADQAKNTVAETVTEEVKNQGLV
ncbi:MAG: DUF3618 domain-containing protein [Acidobacteria bacterium]|nr:DUF3618 domain-containing protein [Acidobacteriota bacterium]